MPHIRTETGTPMEWYSWRKDKFLFVLLKKKMNGKISTYNKFTGVYDSLPLNLWSKYLIEAQVYTI